MKVKATILIIIVSLFSLKSGLLMSYYFAFTENFIERFCENKNQPELECDGKCFLSKMLDKAPAEDHQSQMFFFVEHDLIYVFDLSIASISPITIKEVSYFNYSLDYKSTYLDQQLRPPEAS